MKVPPKRKGKAVAVGDGEPVPASMKVPPKRKGKHVSEARISVRFLQASMKVPPKRKGKGVLQDVFRWRLCASMKVPPKRKGKAGQVEAPNPITGMPQ